MSRYGKAVGRQAGAWAACLVLLGAAAARAQDVRVTKGAGRKSGIDWADVRTDGSPAAGEWLEALGADLLRSGWFVRAAGASAAFRLTGRAEADGRGLSVACAVRDGAGRAAFSRRYRAEADGVRRLAHRVADDLVEALTGRKGFASARLVLVGNRTGRKELYLCDADGRGLVQLTRDASISLYPRWSPDGRRIVYTSYLKGFPDVYLVELQTGDRERVSSHPGLNSGAAFSPDGRSLALVLSRDGNPELYVKRLRSGALTRLTRTPHAAESSPSWSPDGRRIVFVSDRSGSPQLYVVGREGGEPARLTSRGTENVAPDWGPGGLIACASRVGGRYVIGLVHPDTREVRHLGGDYADYEDPSWAPDGRHLACTRTVNYRSSLCLVDIEGDPPQTVLSGRGDWFSPSWSR